MTSTGHDVDLLIVGDDPAAFALALFAAQRFMQVTVVTSGSDGPTGRRVVLGEHAISVLERAGLTDLSQSMTDEADSAMHAELCSALTTTAADAGVQIVTDVPTSVHLAESVTVDITDGSVASITSRWLAGTNGAVRDLLDVDIVDVGSVTVAAQLKAGPAFLVGDGAATHPDSLTSGIVDADNLAWRLQAVHQGHAHDRLLDAYDAERRAQLGAALAGDSTTSVVRVGQLAGSHPLVGRRLPPTSLDGRPLDRRLNHGWAILTSDVGLLPHDLLCTWIGVGARIVMLQADLGCIDGAPAHGAVIVRPDRVVAAVADDTATFTAVSEQLLGWYADGEPTAAPTIEPTAAATSG